MPVAMAGQTLMFRASALINGSSKLILSNRINSVNHTTTSMGIKYDAKALADNAKIPEKPKRPLTAYFRFMLEKRPIVLKENPSMHNTELVKAISEQWKVLSTEAKAKYEEAATQDKEKYNEDILNYNAKLTPEQEQILHQIESDKREDRKKKRIRKEFKAEGKPKGPLTSFGQFVKENVEPGKPFSEHMSALKLKWAELSAVEKEKYQITYKRNRENYELELSKWEAKQIEEGKKHLVRAKTLKKHSLQEKFKEIKLE